MNDRVAVRAILSDSQHYDLYFEGDEHWRPNWAVHTVPTELAERYKRVRTEWDALQEELDEELNP